MKKTYFSPVTRCIDLSMEVGCLGDLSQLPKPDDNPETNVDDEDDVLTHRQGIWGWASDK